MSVVDTWPLWYYCKMFETETENNKIYTVAQLNSLARFILEENFPLILVEGEISNLSQPSSGHLYFSLKDEFAQVRCAMFRGRNNFLDFAPENGMHVLVQAQVSIYEQRGDYQLIIQNMEAAGDGVLRRRFEELKQRLAVEGLFTEEHKKPIPQLPKKIGVITSPTGAAIRDILSVLKRRFAGIPIMVYPTQVQGDLAGNQIVAAIETANKHKECDVLILARGGGSLEDLWPFNEEIVARAIFASEIPIISGVGHETDFTIADFVADKRAPTPSAAAELVSPDSSVWLNNLDNLTAKFNRAMRQKLHHAELILNNLTKRLQHPGKRLQNFSQQIDILEQRLSFAIHNFLKHKKNELLTLSRTLENMSPLATLNRGYAIVSYAATGEILRSVDDVDVGDKIITRLKDGIMESRLDVIHKETVEI